MHKLDTCDARIIYQSLCNEIRLDQRYRERFGANGFFIDYKIMKQVALKSKFGPLLTPIMFALAWIMPFILFTRWILMLGTSLGERVEKGGNHSVWVIPTTPTNDALIRTALTRSRWADFHAVTLNNLAICLPMRLGVSAVMAAGWQALCVVSRIILFSTNRTALLLHARDALSMLLLAQFARSHPDDLFATDCHYQRWSFVLSHTARHLTLVQHGILDLANGLPHKGGVVRQAVVRDEESAEGWRQYFGCIQEVTVYAPSLQLDANPYSDAAVFLASSFPTVDLEIAFFRALRQATPTPLIVKFHPAHRYDNRKLQLATIADHVCRPDEIPSCAVFVSHSSSMEMIYRQNGILTISLLRERTTDAAVTAVMHALREGIRQSTNTTD